MNESSPDRIAVPRILLVEDSERDAKLTLDALAKYNQAHEVSPGTPLRVRTEGS